MAPTHTSSLTTFFGAAPTNPILPTTPIAQMAQMAPIAPIALPTAAVAAIVAPAPMSAVAERKSPAGGEPATAVSSRQVAFVGIVLAVMVALVVVFGMVGDEAGAYDGNFSYAEPTLYIVQPGDSLWSIAEALRPNADPRPLVDELRSAAGSANLQIGQRLLIPSPVAG